MTPMRPTPGPSTAACCRDSPSTAALAPPYSSILTIASPRVREIIMQTLGSGLIYLSSSADDFKNPDIRPYLDRYVRGSNRVEAVDRVKLLKLLWDAVGTEFAGRHELYERN